jgi:outer membrane protein
MMMFGRTSRAIALASSLAISAGLFPAVGFCRQSSGQDSQSQGRSQNETPGQNTQSAARAVASAGSNGFDPSKIALKEVGQPAAGGQAQDPQKSTPDRSPGQDQKLDTEAITRPLEESPPVGRERTGVDLNQVETLTLQDAIRLALLNNLTIEQYRQGVQIQQYNLFSTRGVYDVLSGSTINFNNSTSPTGTASSVSGASNGSLTVKTLNYNFTTQQNFEPTGGLWQVAFNNSRIDTSADVNIVSPQYSPSIQFNVTQPLMRNLSVDANRHTIQVAKQALNLSDSQFRQQVIQIINQVQDAYWELVFAIRNEEIARNTYDLTHKQLQDNRKQVEAGTLAPLDLRQTEAQLENNKGTIIAAKQTITTDENALKMLLLKNPKDKMWNSVMAPADKPEFETPAFSLDELIALALKNRPELEQIRLQALRNQIDVNFYKNQLKPQLDFQGLYNTQGLTGTPTGQGAVPPEFTGGYFKALGQLFSQDFRTIQVGVVSSYPWRNRAARGNYQLGLATARQTDAGERQEIEQIEVDVRNALQAVDAARESYQAAVAGRKAAYAQYVGEEEKFKAGLSSTYLVLQQETAYATAQGTEVRAITNYSEALANLQRYTGTTLVGNNIEIPSTSQEPATNQNPGQSPSQTAPPGGAPNKPPSGPNSTSN